MSPYLEGSSVQEERVVYSDLPIPSSWTAINQTNSGQTYTPETPHTPRSSATFSGTQHVETAATKRKRRPTIARYLGLNNGVGLLHLEDPIESSAQVPNQVFTPEPTPPNTQRNRTRKTRGDGKAQQQRRVSDRLPVTKPTLRKQLKSKGILKDSSVRKDAPPDQANPWTVSANVSVHETVSLPQVQTSSSDSQESSRLVLASRTQQSARKTPQNQPTKASTIVSKETNKSNLPLIEHSSSDDGTAQALSSIYPSQDAADFFDDNIEEILESIDFAFTDNVLPTADHVHNGSPVKSSATQIDDNALYDGLDDDELLRLTTGMINDCTDAYENARALCPLSDLSSPLIHLATDTNQSDTIELTKSPDLSRQFVSPVTGHTQNRVREIDRNEQRKPIVRPAFPSQVRDRSPIIGLTPNTLLRTCFRIGEAINAGRSAIRDGKNVILELYARVLYSKRYNNKQSFVFCDLYHVNAPYINAVYDAAIWKADNQFNYDSARLLREMKMCRCVGQMKKEGTEWVLSISSVWEASWEDIDWVEGIVKS